MSQGLAFTMVDREKQQLERTVRSLLERIEENQRIQQHFREFEFKLLASVRLQELLKLLLEVMPKHFRLQDVGVFLVDRDYTLRDLLKTLQVTHFNNRLQLRPGPEFATSLYGQSWQVQLGELDPLTVSRLFPNSRHIASVALLPLIRRHHLVGSVHFASDDPDRFTADKSTDFMSHLASIIAVCLENCLGHEHLRIQSQVDMLTQVRNRQSFEEQFIRELERAGRNREPLSCMFVDVDHFKSINDQFGHQAGDLCLRKIAGFIQEQLRKTDILGRYGGEEFVVLLPRCPLDTAKLIAERVRQSVAEHTIETSQDVDIQATVSIGLSCWQGEADRRIEVGVYGEQLLRLADEAMYQAKGSGRNRVCIKPFYQLVGP